MIAFNCEQIVMRVPRSGGAVVSIATEAEVERVVTLPNFGKGRPLRAVVATVLVLRIKS